MRVPSLSTGRSASIRVGEFRVLWICSLTDSNGLLEQIHVPFIRLKPVQAGEETTMGKLLCRLYREAAHIRTGELPFDSPNHPIVLPLRQPNQGLSASFAVHIVDPCPQGLPELGGILLRLAAESKCRPIPNVGIRIGREPDQCLHCRRIVGMAKAVNRRIADVSILAVRESDQGGDMSRWTAMPQSKRQRLQYRGIRLRLHQGQQQLTHRSLHFWTRDMPLREDGNSGTANIGIGTLRPRSDLIQQRQGKSPVQNFDCTPEAGIVMIAAAVPHGHQQLRIGARIRTTISHPFRDQLIGFHGHRLPKLRRSGER